MPSQKWLQSLQSLVRRTWDRDRDDSPARTRTRDPLGDRGENVAARYLRNQGYRILTRNFRCPLGEIDIVARDGRTLVFCEVKTRSSTAFGEPVEAVDARKSRRLRTLGATWTDEHPGRWEALRFDVVGILVRPGRGPAQLRHVRGAF